MIPECSNGGGSSRVADLGSNWDGRVKPYLSALTGVDLAGVDDLESLSTADTPGLVDRLVAGVVDVDNSDSGGGMAAPVM